MSKRVYCITSFEKTKDGLNEELFKILQSLEPQTIREDGCIQYIYCYKTYNSSKMQLEKAFQ